MVTVTELPGGTTKLAVLADSFGPGLIGDMIRIPQQLLRRPAVPHGREGP
jgi:hypothetical protein